MDDKDMPPCPWYRSGMVSAVKIQDDEQEFARVDEFAVFCATCGMRGPCAPNIVRARQLFSTVGNLAMRANAVYGRGTPQTRAVECIDMVYDYVKASIEARFYE